MIGINVEKRSKNFNFSKLSRMCKKTITRFFVSFFLLQHNIRKLYYTILIDPVEPSPRVKPSWSKFCKAV